MMMNTEWLYDIYLEGFDDELDNIYDENKYHSIYEKRAYLLGKIDAICGDINTNIDYNRTKEDIIFEILNERHN